MKSQILILTGDIKFSNLTNKSKRKVYKVISKMYNNNYISNNVKFDFNRDIPNMAQSFFEYYPHLFNSYKMETKHNPA